MLVILSIFGVFLGFNVIDYFAEMHRAISAPQQCVAIASAIFWVLVPYTAMKAYYVWQSIENQKAILKALTERPQS